MFKTTNKTSLIIKSIFVIIGGVSGYIYYHFVGCKSGQCAITSNPYLTILYGSLLGYLVGNIIKPKAKKQLFCCSTIFFKKYN